MKKVLLSLLVFFLLLNQLSAQAPTLTSANSSPKPGDNYINQSASVAGLPMFAGGANQSWNYSTIVDSGSAIGFQAVLPSTTPFADSFPGSNVTIKTASDSIFSYFTSSTSSLVANGIATSDGTILKYNPYRTYLTYPFTYNSFYTGNVSLELPGYATLFTGKDSIRGDGYGSLTMPGKTYSNVLRVQYIENLTTTIDSGFFSITTHLRTVSYLYLSPDTHVPVLSDEFAHTTTTTSFLGTSIVSTRDSRSIDYLKSFVLPVSFQSFTASLQNQNMIALQWNTAQEINTDHFTVQRSLTGRDFQDIASIKGGSNTKGSVYNYLDNNFANSMVPATIYYRILETDKDGRQTISDIAMVRGNNAIVIHAFPNPASQYIRISGTGISTADMIVIYDARGAIVKQWQHVSLNQPLYISNLAKGTYVIKVVVNGKTSNTTITKQ